MLIQKLIPLLCALGGLALGWFARGWLNRGPSGFAVLFPSLDAASRVWAPGARVWRLGGRYGATPLTSDEVSRALATYLDGTRRSTPGGHAFTGGACACGQRTTDDPRRCPMAPRKGT